MALGPARPGVGKPTAGGSETLPEQPRVTAMVPCYNAGAFLQATLDSLASQTWSNLEILIGDDCSTDNSLDIAIKFARQHQHVRVLKRPRNLGWLQNSNDLMDHATGEYAFFAFHDDVVLPTYVEALVTALQDNPAAILAYSDLEVFRTDMSMEIRVFDTIAGHKGRLKRGLIMAGRRGDWWIPGGGVFRADAGQTIGGLKPHEQGEFSADWTWLLHMTLLGEFVRVPQVLCKKYYKEGSLSKTWLRDRPQREALRIAGIAEIQGSNIPLPSKLLLKAYLQTDRLRGVLRTYGKRVRKSGA